MKTKVIRMNPQELDMEGIREAGEILRQGGLVAFPTETVYGLDRKSTRLNSSHRSQSRMPSSA